MDEKAFEQMAGTLRGRIVMSMRGLGLNADDADDAAQDVMLRLWQMRDELDEVRSVYAFAVTIAKRMVFSNFRRKSMESIDAKPVVAVSEMADPAEQLESKDNDEWLSSRLSCLPATWHAVLHMRQVEQRSSKEIAALLGITEASVRTLLSRARKRLFDEMKKRG